ncbi:MAG: hypothetical protein V7K62_09165 [Nostoc sp.]
MPDVSVASVSDTLFAFVEKLKSAVSVNSQAIAILIDRPHQLSRGNS